jgi:hypothetical protein
MIHWIITDKNNTIKPCVHRKEEMNMGMFDEVRGEINCNHCGKTTKYYDQFKWSECMLITYEIGDYVYNANKGYDFISGTDICEHCNNEIKGFAILRDGFIIAFLNEEEFKTTNLDSIPTPEEGLGKKLRYQKDCKIGIGRTNEYENFADHPKNIGDAIIALEHEWIIEKVYKKFINENHQHANWAKLRGCLGRKSDRWYVYKVKNNKLGDRFIELEDRYIGTRDRKGNMEVLDKYEFEDVYVYEEIQ